ncbi:hypothetical protein Tco_0674229 [Tanacetum coccineum]
MGYITDSDPKEDPKEHPKEDHVEYPADGGEDYDDESSDDDDDDESSDDDDEDDDDDVDENEEDEEEKEHLAPADSSVVPTDDPIPSADDTKAFETNEFAPTPPSPRSRRARISVRPQTYMAAATDALIAAIPSLPLPLPSPLLPLPAPSSPLLLPATNCRKSSAAATTRQPELEITHAIDIMDATAGRLMSREVGYGIEEVWDDMVGDMEERTVTTIEGLSQRVTYLSTTLARDTHEIYILKAREPEPARDPEPHDEPVDAGTSRLQGFCSSSSYLVWYAKYYRKMPPKRTATTTTPMTNAQIKALIAQGVATALAEYEATRGSGNGDDSTMIPDLAEEGKHLLLVSAPTVTFSNINP